MTRRTVGFMIMPFRPELNYFFLYLKRHMAERHKIDLIRADSDVLTRPLSDKIRTQIATSDFVIADITGGNPNVFFELGLADAMGKPIIFLTQEDPNGAPVDVRPAEKIQYDLSRHVEFLERLDNALRNLFGERHRTLYNDAVQLLVHFNRETGSAFDPATYDEFHGRVEQSEGTVGLPNNADRPSLARFVVPRIIRNPADAATMKRVLDWLEDTFPDVDVAPGARSRAERRGPGPADKP